MKSTVDRGEGLSRKLNVEIPVEKVQEAFEKVYKAIQKKANIKGFRQGKAPLKTIKSIYAEQVKGDVLNELINEGYQNALEQHELDPIGYPKMSFEPLLEEKGFSFTAEFEIRPEVQLKKYEGLPVLRETLEVNEQRVADILENIRKSHAESVTVFEDRALVNGDVAVIDFTGSVSGQPLPNGSAQGHELEIGANQFIAGFEEGLVGMKIGEVRNLNLRFPDGYHEASLSGAPVAFEVKLTGIKKKVLPELNDELAQKLGSEFKTLDDLKTRVRKDIEESERVRIDEEMHNRLVRVLVESNPVEAPKSLVEQQKEALIEDLKGRLEQQGLTKNDFEEYKTKWDSDFTETATFMVKSTFLLDALAERLKLRASNAEFEDKIREYSRQTGIEVSRLHEFYKKPERRSRLLFQITEEKVVGKLAELAEVTEVTRDKLPGESNVAEERA
jgi:trigger factor